jgi:hypothetical protein
MTFGVGTCSFNDGLIVLRSNATAFGRAICVLEYQGQPAQFTGTFQIAP